MFKISKSVSVNRLILRPLILIIIGQVLLFYFMVWRGALKELDENSADAFQNRIEARAHNILSELQYESELLSEYAASVAGAVSLVANTNRVSHRRVIADSAFSNQVFDLVSPSLITMLHNQEATSCFVILGGGPVQQGEYRYRSGIHYKRGQNTSAQAPSYGIIMKYGPVLLGEKYGLSPDGYAAGELEFSHMQDSSFYTVPVENALRDPAQSMATPGYWYVNDSATDILFYSLPLIAQDNTVCGIIGLSFDREYFNNIISKNNCFTEGGYTYFLLSQQSGSSPTNEIFDELALLRNAQYKKISLNDNGHFEITAAAANGKKYYGYTSAITFDNPLNASDGQSLLLCGFVDLDNLRFSSDTFSRSIHYYMLLFVFMGLSFAILIGNHIAAPIRRLSEVIKSCELTESIGTQNTGIKEMDELAQAMCSMQAAVRESSSKLSRIINAINIPIGAYEHNPFTNEVWYTEKLFSVLGMEQYEASQPNGKRFEELLLTIPFEIETSDRMTDDLIMKIKWPHKPVRWVKCSFIAQSNKTVGVFIDVTNDMLAKLRMEHERDYDPLTGLLNRRAFIKKAEELLKGVQHERYAAMLMLGIDNLKYVNNRFGHDWGDEYLRRVANVLKSVPDINGVIGRGASDEFFLFIYGYHNREQIMEFIERLKQSIFGAELKLPNNEKIRLRVSAGISWYPEDSQKVTELMLFADSALYNVKTTSKGEFGEYEVGNYNQNSYLLSAGEQLNKLIEGNLVEFQFQPIVSALDGSVFAYEALMRSGLETLSSVSEILTVARAQSKQYQIERMTWFKAMSDFIEKGFAQTKAKIFINSISNQFLTVGDVVAYEKLFADYLPFIVLEVTEDEKLNQRLSDEKNALMEKWGAAIALDDFGSGYNSEVALLSLNPQFVKIDMSIVRNIDAIASKQKVFSNWISYCHEHGIKVIAEGIETLGELRTVRRLGADYFQGYYFARPSHEIASIDPQKIQDMLSD